MTRGTCACGYRLGRHAFVSNDGRALQCGRCFAGKRRDARPSTSFERLAERLNARAA